MRVALDHLHTWIAAVCLTIPLNLLLQLDTELSIYLGNLYRRYKRTTQRRSQPWPGQNEDHRNDRKSQTDHTEGKSFQIVGPAIEKALCCFMIVQERGIT